MDPSARDCDFSVLRSFFGNTLSVCVDAAIVCHEVRCPDFSPQEKACVSFRVLGEAEDNEAFLSPGEIHHLSSLPVDSTVEVRVWAVPQEAPSRIEFVQKRPCGSACIPLRHLAARFGGALYYSWMALDDADSGSASASDRGGDKGGAEAFANALMNGPRDLSQPKACLTICKADDIWPSGQAAWAADFPRKSRVAHWAPLLRSQQQHAYMCSAQQAQLNKDLQQREHRIQAARHKEELLKQEGQQAQELEALREQLHQAKREEVGQEARAQAQAHREAKEKALRELEVKGARSLAEARAIAETYEAAQEAAAQEVEQQRCIAERLRGQMSELKGEFKKIGDEANKKIEAANLRIRSLRTERDEGELEAKEGTLLCQKLRASQEELVGERDRLAEQKEKLMKVIEDLDQACSKQGLSILSRQSLEHSIRNHLATNIPTTSSLGRSQ
jgi:hypothetical protein